MQVPWRTDWLTEIIEFRCSFFPPYHFQSPLCSGLFLTAWRPGSQSCWVAFFLQWTGFLHNPKIFDLKAVGSTTRSLLVSLQQIHLCVPHCPSWIKQLKTELLCAFHGKTFIQQNCLNNHSKEVLDFPNFSCLYNCHSLLQLSDPFEFSLWIFLLLHLMVSFLLSPQISLHCFFFFLLTSFLNIGSFPPKPFILILREHIFPRIPFSFAED